MTDNERNEKALKAIDEWNNDKNQEFTIAKIGESKWQIIRHNEVLCVCINPYYVMVLVQALTIAMNHCTQAAILELLEEVLANG